MSDQEKKSAIDKIIMGAIIGTAIGSAVSLTVAPKKGSETREDVKQVTKDTASGFYRLGKAILRRLFRGKKTKENPVHRPMKALPNEMEVLPPEKSDPNQR